VTISISPDDPARIARTCEEILLSLGRSAEAYEPYALASNRGTSNIATYRSIARKYPEREPAQILRDLIAPPPGEEGKWFAAAKEAGQIEMAGELANQSPCDPKTLTRAARDFVEKNPGFALTVGLVALRWLSAGYGYEVSGADIWAAYSHTMAAAEHLGRHEEVRERVRVLVCQQGVCRAGAQQGTRARRAVAPWNAQARRRKRNQGARFTKSLLNNRSDSRTPS